MAKRKRHTILVVDDEADVVKSVQDLLRLDYRVLGTTRAADALKIMQTEEVHVVMSDQRMPEMTGVEFLHAVRGDYPEAMRLLFTGYADIRAVIDAINQGNVYRYLTKPWDPDELQSVIREAIDRYELIVERNRLTTELTNKNTELTHKIEELAAVNTQLAEAGALKTAFIRVASHELRTPVAILVGLTKLLSSMRDVPTSVSSWLPRIGVAGERLQHLIDQLLAMLSAGRFEHTLELQDVEVAALLREAIDDVRPFVELRRQHIVEDVAPDAGTIRADRDKLRECLNHLLLNAIKFTADDGTITVAGRAAGEGVELRVTDTGVGMDAASQARLFEPFFTGFDVSHHSTGTYEFGRKGLGLGLSVVKGFVEMHGGSVAVHSEPDKGATLTITLPRTPPEKPASAVKAEAPAAAQEAPVTPGVVA